MKYLILAVLLAVAQTAVPVPRKTADTAARSGQSVKKDTKTQKQPASPPPAAPESIAAKPDQGQSQNPSSANPKETIIIREPTSVSRKDAWDKAYVVFTGLLFVIGGIGVWLARRSLIAIEAQIDTMKQQVSEMRSAGKQTNDVIEIMRDTAFRELRAYVCMSSAQIAFVQERAPEVQVHIKNCGKTPAYDVEMWIGAVIGPYPLPLTLPPPSAGFTKSKSLLAPGERPHAMVWRHPVIAEQLMPIFGTPELTMFVYGEITYRDAFGKQRITRYRLIYGGTEPMRLKDRNGIAVGFLKPDTMGNEAN